MQPKYKNSNLYGVIMSGRKNGFFVWQFNSRCFSRIDRSLVSGQNAISSNSFLKEEFFYYNALCFITLCQKSMLYDFYFLCYTTVLKKGRKNSLGKKAMNEKLKNEVTVTSVQTYKNQESTRINIAVSALLPIFCHQLISGFNYPYSLGS